MGKRLTRIYTRTGDKGTTGLGDGARVKKDSPRIEVMGDIDELNATIAMALAFVEDNPPLRQCLRRVQNDLFDLGGEVAVPGRRAVSAVHVERLEQDIDAFNADLPPLENFILPAGGPAAAACHLARTVCRRAERALVALGHHESLGESSVAYLNRLSDLLFVAARTLTAPGEEHLWEPGATAGGPDT